MFRFPAEDGPSFPSKSLSTLVKRFRTTTAAAMTSDLSTGQVESRILNRAENLAKLTAAVLNAERSDHLLIRGRGQLLEDEKLFRELSNVINVLISDLAEKTPLRLGDITHELKRIEQQRRQGETKLQDHLSMVESIYTYGDELEIPKELRLWSIVTHIPHARLIDVHDRYDASVQIPAAYPTLLDPLERNDEAVLKPLMR